MPWEEILRLIGTGSQYEVSRSAYLSAIRQAHFDGHYDAAHHLRIMLERRDAVRLDTLNKHPADHWLFGSSSTAGEGQLDEVTPVTAPASKAPAR